MRIPSDLDMKPGEFIVIWPDGRIFYGMAKSIRMTDVADFQSNESWTTDLEIDVQLAFQTNLEDDIDADL